MNFQLPIGERPPIGKTAGVAEQHAQGDLFVARIASQIRISRIFRQRLGKILVDGLVEIENFFFDQLHDHVAKNAFAQRSRDHHGIRCQRQSPLFVADAVGFQIRNFPIVENRDAHAGDARCLHQPGDGGVNLLRRNRAAVETLDR